MPAHSPVDCILFLSLLSRADQFLGKTNQLDLGWESVRSEIQSTLWLKMKWWFRASTRDCTRDRIRYRKFNNHNDKKQTNSLRPGRSIKLQSSFMKEPYEQFIKKWRVVIFIGKNWVIGKIIKSDKTGITAILILNEKSSYPCWLFFNLGKKAHHGILLLILRN